MRREKNPKPSGNGLNSGTGDLLIAEKLQYLHKVTGLKRRIQILPSAKRSPCEVCKLSKLWNQIHKELSPWKNMILELVSVDACGPLPRTLRGNQYFSQIVDNATCKAWVILTKSRTDLV